METASIDHLLHELGASGASVIAIDGYLGVGKTTIAKKISSVLDCNIIHLDNFLGRGKGNFVGHMNWPMLKNAIYHAGRPVIIEGLCVLEILKRLGTEPDYVIYVTGKHAQYNERDSRLFQEVDEYHREFLPSKTANIAFSMNNYHKSTSVELDIAYIKAKTVISVVLAIGGILSILVGALVFVLGAEGTDSALIRIGSFEVSAKGIGGVILVTSAVWAYIAYLARPIYSRKHEIKEVKNADGSVEREEFVSTTQMEVRPDDK